MRDVTTCQLLFRIEGLNLRPTAAASVARQVSWLPPPLSRPSRPLGSAQNIDPSVRPSASHSHSRSAKWKRERGRERSEDKDIFIVGDMCRWEHWARKTVTLRLCLQAKGKFAKYVTYYSNSKVSRIRLAQVINRVKGDDICVAYYV